jgi:hypothetical protein
MFVHLHHLSLNGKSENQTIFTCFFLINYYLLFLSRHRRHTSRVSPTDDDCPECRALAAQGFPTMCDCSECRTNRAAYPNRVPYCDCEECRNTKRTF